MHPLRTSPFLLLALASCGGLAATPATDASLDVGDALPNGTLDGASGDADLRDAGQDASYDAADVGPPPRPFTDCTDPIPPIPGAPLYDRLGRADGVRCIMASALVAQLKDPVQAQYFVLIGQPGHPTYADVLDCTTLLIGSGIGGPEKYTATLPDGYACRLLTPSHASLHVTNGVYSDMIAIVLASAVRHGVTPSDVLIVRALLQSVQDQIVDPKVPDGG